MPRILDPDARARKEANELANAPGHFKRLDELPAPAIQPLVTSAFRAHVHKSLSRKLKAKFGAACEGERPPWIVPINALIHCVYQDQCDDYVRRHKGTNPTSPVVGVFVDCVIFVPVSDLSTAHVAALDKRVIEQAPRKKRSAVATATATVRAKAGSGIPPKPKRKENDIDKKIRELKAKTRKIRKMKESLQKGM